MVSASITAEIAGVPPVVLSGLHGLEEQVGSESGSSGRRTVLQVLDYGLSGEDFTGASSTIAGPPCSTRCRPSPCAGLAPARRALRRLRPARDLRPASRPSTTPAPGPGAVRWSDRGRFPRSLPSGRRVRHPALPLRLATAELASRPTLRACRATKSTSWQATRTGRPAGSSPGPIRAQRRQTVRLCAGRRPRPLRCGMPLSASSCVGRDFGPLRAPALAADAGPRVFRPPPATRWSQAR